jgi:hypothetical protein
MNEKQWLTTDQVTWLLCHAETVCSERKFAQFQIECARQLIDVDDGSELSELFRRVELSLTENASAEVVDAAEAPARQYATASRELLFQGVAEARGRNRHFVRELSQAAVAAGLLHSALTSESWWRTTGDIDDGPELDQYRAYEGYREAWSQQHIPLLRCIVGNPFRPVVFDPAWRTETAVALASAIYAERAFDRLPILADALEEAGCDNTDVLAHCRGPGPHARGCWVVDGVLGKS